MKQGPTIFATLFLLMSAEWVTTYVFGTIQTTGPATTHPEKPLTSLHVGLGGAKISVADDPSYDTPVSPSLLDLSGYFVNIVFIGPFIFSVRNGT